ncbi:protein-tyrosine-phosphatase [Candidatus Frankia alpina]|uniref:Protein-tyrosine-phosphatase n=2 Tax=Candidatus Frankia alpina TaxID=2699483 RepID=A0A4S5EUC4_9ACTN|nr:protein-tyrosine-phosphatase [Candidatus Frankia alpina]
MRHPRPARSQLAAREELAMQQRPWAVLMVCTGNLCRSPLAEHLALAWFAAALAQADTHPVGAWEPPGCAGGLLVSSAGTQARADRTMHPHAAAILTARGMDPAGFRARRLTPELILANDLVLCATRAQRSAVVGLTPRALRRTFTMREFGRLTSSVRSAGLPEGGVRAIGEYLAAVAWRMRAARQAPSVAADDLIDPVNGDLHAFDECARIIGTALAHPMALLAEGARDTRAARRSPDPPVPDAAGPPSAGPTPRRPRAMARR